MPKPALFDAASWIGREVGRNRRLVPKRGGLSGSSAGKARFRERAVVTQRSPRNQLPKRLKLKGVGPAAEMEPDLQRRMNLVTGDNGPGRSIRPDVASRVLARNWPRDLNPRLTSGDAARPTDRKSPAVTSFAPRVPGLLDAVRRSGTRAGLQRLPPNPALRSSRTRTPPMPSWEVPKNAPVTRPASPPDWTNVLPLTVTL